jgi:hypothetical protein
VKEMEIYVADKFYMRMTVENTHVSLKEYIIMRESSYNAKMIESRDWRVFNRIEFDSEEDMGMFILRFV